MLFRSSYAAAATLLTGFAVLIGAAAAGERARTFEAAVLKTVGASRRRILTSFMLRAAMLGAAAGLVALLAGAVVAWGVISFVMGASYQFDAVSALTIVGGGAGATLLSGLAFAWRPLAARPAHILRMREQWLGTDGRDSVIQRYAWTQTKVRPSPVAAPSERYAERLEHFLRKKNLALAGWPENPRDRQKQITL